MAWIDDLEATIDKDRIGTHWEDCYLVHRDCAILRLIDVARAGRELFRLVDSVEVADQWEDEDLSRNLGAALAAFREAEGG